VSAYLIAQKDQDIIETQFASIKGHPYFRAFNTILCRSKHVNLSRARVDDLICGHQDKMNDSFNETLAQVIEMCREKEK